MSLYETDNWPRYPGTFLRLHFCGECGAWKKQRGEWGYCNRAGSEYRGQARREMDESCRVADSSPDDFRRCPACGRQRAYSPSLACVDGQEIILRPRCACKAPATPKSRRKPYEVVWRDGKLKLETVGKE